MLDSLRSAAGTWVAKLLLGILVISFAVWGITGRMIQSGGFHGDAVVVAGGTKISVVEYRLAYDRMLNILSQRFGQRLTPEQATALGVDNQVLGQLVSDAVLDEQARLMHLGLSRDRIAALTAEDPAFKGEDGQFNRQQFEYILRQVGMRPEDYFENRAQAARRQQIVQAMSDGMRVPDTFLHAVALYRGEDRTVDYLSLPKSLVEPVEAPSEDVLSKWFDAHKADYTAPEYRKISYLRMSPADIADESAVTDEQVRAAYDRDKAQRYTTPETRTIEQIVYPTREAAEAAVASLKEGATFDKLVAAQGKTEQDTQLGTFARDKIPDKAVADAAFALSLNQVSDVVDGSFGPVLVRVTAINPQVVKPLEEVAAQIRKELAVSAAAKILIEVRDKYEDARAGGATMSEAAKQLNLKVVTVDAVDRSGQAPDGQILKDLPASPDLLKAAFETQVGDDNAAIVLNSGGYVYFELDAVTPARERPLSEVHDKALAAWTTEETNKRLAAKGDELAKRVKDGTALDVIAGELKLEKQTKRGLKRDADDGDLGKDGVAAVFGVAQNGSGVFAAPTGDARILFKVTEVFEPAASDPSAVPDQDRKNYAAGISEDLLDQLVAKLQTEFDVTVNRDVAEQAHAY